MDVSEGVLATLDAGYPCPYDEICFCFSAMDTKLMNQLIVAKFPQPSRSTNT
jgi:hypothetical protein